MSGRPPAPSFTFSLSSSGVAVVQLVPRQVVGHSQTHASGIEIRYHFAQQSAAALGLRLGRRTRGAFDRQRPQILPNQRRHRRIQLRRSNPRPPICRVVHRNRNIPHFHSSTVPVIHSLCQPPRQVRPPPSSRRPQPGSSLPCPYPSQAPEPFVVSRPRVFGGPCRTTPPTPNPPTDLPSSPSHYSPLCPLPLSKERRNLDMRKG